MNFQEQYDRYLKAAEEGIAAFAEAMHFTPPILTDSMRYSLLAGGKRIRPVLFYAALDALGHDYASEQELAVALECIHTYSLIHDDLPAMDNDDFRRGKPSNHRVFGEANAILAGDALLSYAFDLMLKAAQRDEKHLLAAQRLSFAAGAEGMVAGQSADLLYAGKDGGEKELFFIYENKTARLLTAPLEMAALLADGNVAAATEFGKNFGILFQLTDDILDEKGTDGRMGKTLGKDKIEDKLTCVKVFGMEKSEALADEYVAKCNGSLKKFTKNTEFFEGIIALVRRRDH